MATLTEVFPCFFLGCKANARVKPAKTGQRPHSSKFLCCSMYFLRSMYFCVVLCIVCFVPFSVLFVCIYVLYDCHRVATQLQINTSYNIISIPTHVNKPLFHLCFWIYLLRCIWQKCLCQHVCTNLLYVVVISLRSLLLECWVTILVTRAIYLERRFCKTAPNSRSEQVACGPLNVLQKCDKLFRLIRITCLLSSN